MSWLGTLFLYLHIGGAIVAFGPTIAFPFIAAKAAKEPMHGNFALRVTQFISDRVVEPAAIFVFLMGVGLIITKGYNPLVDLWVSAAIVLFVIALAFSILVQAKTVRRMIELTSQPPVVVTDAIAPGEQPAMAGPGTPAASGAGPAGPPAEFVALAARAERGGQLLLVLLFAILFLMVFKPF